MTNDPPIPFRDDELWAMFASRARNESDANQPEIIEYAAYLEGRATDSERERVEAWLAAQAGSADELRTSRALVEEVRSSTVFVPPHALEAAKALVDSPEQVAPEVEILRRPMRFTRWGLSAAASIAVCLGGYQFGFVTNTTSSGPTVDVLDEMSFGLMSSSGESLPDDLLWLAMGEDL